MKILLLEDDITLQQSLQLYLEADGFLVDVASNADEAYEKTFENSYDFYLFDINLPDESGFEVLKNLKNSGDETPTFYISALVDISSISKGFEIGAEDYIKKPFDPEELVVRIKSKLALNQKLLTYKDITYDPQTSQILKDGKAEYLGNIQLKLFDKLIRNKSKVVSQYDLLDLLEQPSTNALRVNLAKLKNKLNLTIKNIRTQGYILEEVWERVLF